MSRVADARAAEQTLLCEGARWDDRRGELLRVDTIAGRVYRDRCAADCGLVAVRSYRIPGTVGATTGSKMVVDGGRIYATIVR